MSEVLPRDVLLRFGGRVLQRHGVLAVAGAARGVREVTETFTRADPSTFAASIGRDAMVRKAAANVPRLEYVDLDGDGIRETPGWLIEPSRPNTWDRSTEFANAAWTKASGVTVATDAVVAPDGGLADNLVEASANQSHWFARALTGTADNTRQTFYWIVRAGVRGWGYIEGRRKDGTFQSAFVNLTTGAIGQTSLSASSSVRVYGGLFSGIAAGPFWVVAMTFDVLSGGTTPQGLFAAATADGTLIYTGNGSHAISVWQAQFELDKHYETSPIITGASSLTRAGEAATLPIAQGRMVATIYGDVIERTLQLGSGHDNRLIGISGGTFTAPYFAVQSFLTNGYRAIADLGGGLISSGNLSHGAFNDRVRFTARLVDLGPDGLGGRLVRVEFSRRLNNGAVADATASATTSLTPGVWNAQTIWVGAGNGTGTIAPDARIFLDGMILRDSHTQAECEAVP